MFLVSCVSCSDLVRMCKSFCIRHLLPPKAKCGAKRKKVKCSAAKKSVFSLLRANDFSLKCCFRHGDVRINRMARTFYIAPGEGANHLQFCAGFGSLMQCKTIVS